MHGLACLGISTHPCLTVFHLECSESNQLNFTLGADAVGDGIQHCGDRIFGSALCCVPAQGPVDSFDKFSFVHSTSKIGSSDTFCKVKTGSLHSTDYKWVMQY